jgi:hypothetical protein
MTRTIDNKLFEQRLIDIYRKLATECVEKGAIFRRYGADGKVYCRYAEKSIAPEFTQCQYLYNNKFCKYKK